jgi:uncharacterized protein (DUF2132 family)
MNDQPNNPLHGLTLEKILCDLVNHYGWDELYNMIEIRCFYNDPSIKSSLKFLRKTNWARVKIEERNVSTLFFTNEQIAAIREPGCRCSPHKALNKITVT